MPECFSIPMWHENTIYFLSDRGPGARANIWSYDLNSKQVKQITKFTDYDIHFPSIGPSDIVFEMGGKLYRLSLADESVHEVNVKVVTDEIMLLPRSQNVSKYIRSASLSPDGKRALFEARGEVFSVPAEHGPVINLTRTPGSDKKLTSYGPGFRYRPYWSPNSKMIAFIHKSTR